MQLVFPAPEHKQAAWDYRQEHLDCGETWIHGSAGLHQAEDYDAWLAGVIGLVWFAFVDGKLVGTVAVRDGYVGYGVRPSERQKGYAAKMLGLALEKCRARKMEKLLAICDQSNVASIKTVLKNGGVLEDEYTDDDGNVMRRYWIML